MGAVLMKTLHELEEKYPEKVNNVRGLGLMDAFDLANTEMRDKFYNEAYKNGLLVLKCGEKGIRFRPPLIVEEEHINIAAEIMDKILATL